MRLVQAGNETLFEVAFYQPGTSTASVLADQEKLALSIVLVPGSSMSKPELAKAVTIPGEPTEKGFATRPATAPTTLANVG
ncbi:MAG: hypothetical protein KDJ52_24015 [Anaerolineae bacterium]|nr:hypothetical protein [Anaerolineae bacterium]